MVTYTTGTANSDAIEGIEKNAVSMHRAKTPISSVPTFKK